MSGNPNKNVKKLSNIHKAFKSPFRSPIVRGIQPIQVAIDDSSSFNIQNDKNSSDNVEIKDCNSENKSFGLTIANNNTKNSSTPKSISTFCSRTASADGTSLTENPNKSNTQKCEYLEKSTTPKLLTTFRTPFKSPLLAAVLLPTDGGQSPTLKRSGFAASNSNTPKRSMQTNTIKPRTLKNLEKNEQELKLLLEKEKQIDSEIEQLEDEGYKVEELQDLIAKLHLYNDLKDTAQMIMGRLAEIDCLSIAEMHIKYKVNDIN